MHRKLLKYIQDSDVAITILLFAIAGLSFRGVPDNIWNDYLYICLLYTSPSPRDRTRSRMPSSA